MVTRSIVVAGSLMGSLLIGAPTAATVQTEGELPPEATIEDDEEEILDVPITPDLARSDDRFIAGREKYGLPVDEKSMAQAVEDTWTREIVSSAAEVDPLGLPLSDAELEMALSYIRITEDDSTRLHDYLEANSDTTAELVWDIDIDDLGVLIQVTDGFADDFSAFEDLVPDGLRWDIATVEFSRDDLDAVFDDYVAETSGLEGVFGIRATLESLGMEPMEALFGNGSQSLTVAVDDRNESRTQEELTEIANDALSGVRGVPTIKIDLRSPSVESEARWDSPGPGKGGLRILRSDTNGACSTGFSARIGSKVYVLTAGHCRSGNTRWQHSGGTGADYGLIPSDLFSNVNATPTRTWARDHGYLDEDTTSTGIGSGYYMNIAANGAITLEATTGMRASDERNSGVTVCQNGASPRRGQINTVNSQRRLCGVIVDRATNGKLLVDADVCDGDSGGPVSASFNTAYGLVEGSPDFNLSDDCGDQMYYVRISNALAHEGASLVTTGSDNPMMLQNDIFTPNGSNDCQNSACCMSADGPPPAIFNYTTYLQWTCLQDNSNQDFYFEPVAPASGHNTDHYRLIRFYGATPYCLSVEGTSGANWSDVHSWKCIGSASSPDDRQVWHLTYEVNTPDGFFEVRSEEGGRCLSVAGGPTQNDRGANIHLWACGNANDAQVWKVR